MNANDWEYKLTNMTVDRMWNHFVKTFNEYQDKYIPVMKARVRASPPWLSKDIIKQIRIRNKSWIKFKQYPTYSNESKYKKIRNNLITLIRDAKTKYENKIANKIKVNPKAFYSYVRSKCKSKTTIGPLKNNGGYLVHDSQEMATEL